ncbi:hypothetical protein AVEN_221769-1 [Araneus ventricosus]|uniref:Core Histone H2A/H2B/H3 domain-containing protein n=1 Tax=Araneus ventricosus TaxID=182803 RepID=A0A4Y2FMG9_ARAVE|nr:hypothetical protein AVEN_221769-1 [Araneus ventricosus]
MATDLRQGSGLFYFYCGESFRNAEGEASDSNKRLPPPVSEEPSGLRANTQMEALRNLEMCSKISEHRPESARKKDSDPCFEAVLRNIEEQVSEEITLSEDAVYSTGVMLMKVLDTIASRAARLTAFRKRKTLTMADLRMAIEITLPPRMAFMADRNASLKLQGKDG